jgi:hypothetical protein
MMGSAGASPAIFGASPKIQNSSLRLDEPTPSSPHRLLRPSRFRVLRVTVGSGRSNRIVTAANDETNLGACPHAQRKGGGSPPCASETRRHTHPVEWHTARMLEG